MEETPEHIKRLKKVAAALPTLPGVYLMKDFDGTIIYIGKAKDLRARVRTYFAGGDGRLQIEYLLRRVASLDKIVTGTEEEAFLLERDLINRHKPRYNIRLRDDKAYLSVRLDPNKEWPRLELVRRVDQDGALYFGPYTNGYQLRQVLDVIKNVVPLRTCSDTVFFNRQRPCLEYQIKRCAGPCCLPVSRESYDEWVSQATAILEGRIEPTIHRLESQMTVASEELRFEEAAAIRDRITRLTAFAEGEARLAHRGESSDCFNFYREGECIAFSILKARSGRISDVVNYSFEGVHIADDEVLESVITQYYEQHKEIPDEVLVPFLPSNAPLIESVMSERCGEAFSLSVPDTGSRGRLLSLAEVNAKQQYSVRFLAEARYQEIAKELARLFNLRQLPRRVECVDISNFQGSDIVGAIVCFADGVPEKREYRKYRLSFQDKPDDFAAIHEVVSRRLARKEDLPDLLIIDGGKMQLQKALEARDELGVKLEIISIAKMRTDRNVYSKDVSYKPERIFIEGADEPIPLDSKSEVTHYLQKVRDEVHRFVITFHRSSRSKRVFASALDAISGLGPERRRRLLSHFGSVESMRGIAAEEIAKIGRMPLPLAEKVIKSIAR